MKKLAIIKLNVLAGLLLLSGACGTALYAAKNITVTKLSTAYHVNPMGIGTPVPRLSWILESEAEDQIQSACQVMVASSPKLQGS